MVVSILTVVPPSILLAKSSAVISVPAVAVFNVYAVVLPSAMSPIVTVFPASAALIASLTSSIVLASIVLPAAPKIVFPFTTLPACITSAFVFFAVVPSPS